MTRGPLLVVGDALLDRDLDGRAERLSPDAPVPVVDANRSRSRPGGAALAAALAARDGHDVVFVTAFAADAAGRELAALLEREGVEVVNLGAATPTAEKVRVRADGHALLRVDHGGPVTAGIGEPGPDAEAALASAAAVLVSDYGRGVAAHPAIRARLGALDRRIPRVWDPHPRGAAAVAGMWLVTPNQAEAARLVPGVDGDGLPAQAARARRLARQWHADAVAVTLGAGGALLAWDDEMPLVVPAEPVPGDPCGAGDRFAAAAAGLLAGGALPTEAVVGAVAAAGAFVAAGGAGAFSSAGAAVPGRAEPGTGDDAAAVVARVRAEGGTVVATGGCFDLLHAGHVRTLEGARALGDCLVVLLNSDDSVRRLKGPDRPLNPAADRAAVLRALGCVDAVVVFDEDTPVAALERLRPDVFVKGGDYSARSLPEAAALARWGGEVVVLPYVEGRSTTGLMKEMVRRGMGG